jgi:imidazolonepropionase-like amidohydrolase
MSKLARYFTALLLTSVVAAGTASAADQTSATEKDPLKATLLESKEKNRGVTIHANGASIGCVVTAVDEHYVIGRSNQASRIVIRLDRIDGVSAMF